MSIKQFEAYFNGLFGSGSACRRKKHSPTEEIRPLSDCFGCCRVKVCRIAGDRRICGRMASMGLLPGTMLELLCPDRGCNRQCMVKVNGGTITLDAPTAASIFVQPA